MGSIFKNLKIFPIKVTQVKNKITQNMNLKNSSNLQIEQDSSVQFNIVKQMYLIQTYIVRIFPTENLINKSAFVSPRYAINVSLTKPYMTGD
jgi:hypothetical protein